MAGETHEEFAGGALGWRWRRVPRPERVPVVRQVHEDGCGPACAEMLLRDRGIDVSQAVVATGMMLPATAHDLAARMCVVARLAPETWKGTFAALDSPTPGLIATLSIRHGTWAALLEPVGWRGPGHWVVVDGIAEDDVVWVRDPEGLSYGLVIDEFLELWHYTMVVIEGELR